MRHIIIQYNMSKHCNNCINWYQCKVESKWVVNNQKNEPVSLKQYFLLNEYKKTHSGPFEYPWSSNNTRRELLVIHSQSLNGIVPSFRHTITCPAAAAPFSTAQHQRLLEGRHIAGITDWESLAGTIHHSLNRLDFSLMRLLILVSCKLNSFSLTNLPRLTIVLVSKKLKLFKRIYSVYY